MAFGHAVKRGGFDAKLKNVADRHIADDNGLEGQGDEQIKGTRDADSIDGGGGDDVIIGFSGDDTLIGGDGEDDLSGGEGDDTLVGGIIDGDVGSEVWSQDNYSDDYNAESTFEDNGTDTILGYDDDTTDFDNSGVVDVIDFSDNIDFEDPSDDSIPTTDVEKETQLNATLSYDNTTGELSDSEANVWFNVHSDDQGTAASTVYVEVDGDVFQWDGSGWDLQENWDLV
jgi:hypothetical protein